MTVYKLTIILVLADLVMDDLKTECRSKLDHFFRNDDLNL